jgi:tetratricopeptide (TPR) repeat protein
LSRLPDDSPRNHLHRSVLLYNTAQVYRRSNRLAEAVSCYGDVLQLDPNMPEYRCELAQCLIALEDFEGAKQELTQALALDPFIPETHAMLGFVAAKLGLANESADHYRSAWALDPTPESCYALAFRLVAVGSFDQARAVLETQDLEQVPRGLLPSFAATLAEAHIGLKNEVGARETLEATLALLPDDPRTLRNLAWVDRRRADGPIGPSSMPRQIPSRHAI